MKIAIDCRMLDMSGIGAYLRNFLDKALFTYSDIHFLLIGTSVLMKYADLQNVTVKIVNIPPFSVKEMLTYPVNEVNVCDLYFNPNYNIPCGIKIPICCTIHDLLFWDVKGVSSSIGRWVRVLAVKRAYHLSILIFTVSRFSLSRIHRHLGRKQAIVTYNALRPIFVKSVPLKSGRKYLIFVGNVKPHKGLKDLLVAYNDFSLHNDYDLVIVGDYQNFKTAYPEILEYVGQKGISFTGKVSDEKLLELISNAAMLVQPSVYEGFGIPPMEALYLGVPVVLSDIPVFREIYSDFPVCFFEVQNPESLAEAIRRVKSYDKDTVELIRNKISSLYNATCISHRIMQALIDVCNESSSCR